MTTPPPTHTHLPCRLLVAGRYAGTDNVDWHAHEGHEIILVTAGRCRMSAGRERWFEGQAGTLYVLPAGAEQYHLSHEFTRDVYLIFHASAAVFTATARTLQVPLDGLTARLFEEICTLSMSPAGEVQPVLDALLLALLEELSRLEQRARTSGARHPALQLAVDYMEANLSRPLAVEEIARRAALSPSHLTALCRREFGLPPLKLHTRWRLELAAKLLRGRMRRSKEVAAAIGFEDVNYFIRQFRRHFGHAPAAWLRRQDTTGKG